MITGYEFVEKLFSASKLKDELKEAIREGDEERVNDLKKQIIKRKTAAGAIIGGAAGGLGFKGLSKFTNADEFRKEYPEFSNISDKGYNDAVNMGAGLIAAGGAGVGALAKNLASRRRFKKILKKAEDEVREENKSKK